MGEGLPTEASPIPTSCRPAPRTKARTAVRRLLYHSLLHWLPGAAVQPLGRSLATSDICCHRERHRSGLLGHSWGFRRPRQRRARSRNDRSGCHSMPSGGTRHG